MSDSRLGALVEDLASTTGTSDSLYGLGYLLILHQEQFRELEPLVVDTLLGSVRPVPRSKKLMYLRDTNSLPQQYSISPFANCAIAILAYVGLEDFSMRTEYRRTEIKQLLPRLNAFIKHECSRLTDRDAKTIGFELVVHRFQQRIPALQKHPQARAYAALGAQRLNRFSPTMAFSPEGVSGLWNHLQLWLLTYRLIGTVNNPTFILNSTETSLFSLPWWHEQWPDGVSRLQTYLLQHKGFPAMFRCELFQLFWTVNILQNAGVLDQSLNRLMISICRRLRLTEDSIAGNFHPFKGFSIAQGFPLYDLDTTAMGLLALHTLDYKGIPYKDFSLEYYANRENGLFYTYRHDNRVSATTLAHTLSWLTRTGKLSDTIPNYLIKQLHEGTLSDKWHTSQLYTLYCIATGLSDYSTMKSLPLPVWRTLIQRIVSLQQPNNLFSSIKGTHGTVEESAWAILALQYIARHQPRYTQQLSEIISTTQSAIAHNLKTTTAGLEHLWVIKFPYTPKPLHDILLHTSLQVRI